MSETGETAGSGRYFVTVIATGREALLALSQLELDLFKPTAKPAPPEAGGAEGEYRIDGLLTLEEIGRLVSAGYRVLVQADAAQKARGQIAPRRAYPAGEAPEPAGPVGFEEWLKGMEPPAAPPARPPRPRRRQQGE